jgi:hypothetical protein
MTFFKYLPLIKYDISPGDVLGLNTDSKSILCFSPVLFFKEVFLPSIGEKERVRPDHNE